MSEFEQVIEAKENRPYCERVETNLTRRKIRLKSGKVASHGEFLEWLRGSRRASRLGGKVIAKVCRCGKFFLAEEHPVCPNCGRGI